MPLTLAADIIQPASANFISFVGAPTGFPLAINVISNGVRTSVGTNGNYQLFSGTFTKLRSDTVLRASATVFGAGYSSGNCGVGLVLDFGTPSVNWDFGMAYQYDGAWSSTQQTTMVFGQCQWSSIPSGSHTIGFGWKPASGGTGERPFVTLNPNASDDSRNNQMVSRIVVYEVYP